MVQVNAAQPIRHASPRAPSPPPLLRLRLTQVRSWLHAHCIAHVLELHDLPAAALAQGAADLPSEYDFREAALQELPACAAMARMPLEEFHRRWQQGDQCFVAFLRGQPVNVSWLHFGPCYVRGLSTAIAAAASDCYLYNVFTAEACRGQGLYKITQRRLIGLLAARGVARIRQVVTLDNQVPLHTLPQLGYRVTQSIAHRRILGIAWTSVTEVPGGARRRTWCSTAPRSVFRI